MGKLSVNLCGIELDNPIIPASGVFGYGREFAALYDLDILGSFSFKGTTLHPREGNPTPRIAECPAGMLNAVGLQNPGVAAVIARELPEIAKIFHKPVMANVSGFSLEEYAETCAALDAQDQVGWLEVNISCPNVHQGGMSFGTEPESAAAVVKAVKAVAKKPVLVKLTPNVTDIAAVAKAAEDAGADGLSLINTVLAMRIDPRTRRPVLANGNRRPLWACGAAHRGAYGVPGLRGRVHPHRRHGGRKLRPGRDRADAGRGHCRGGGGRQPHRPLRLPENHKRTAQNHGRVPH